MEQKGASVGMDAFIVHPEPPRRNERLTLDLLDIIARATEGGQSVKSIELETLRGWTPEQIKRELKLLWDEGLIRGTDTKDLSKSVSMLIRDLSPAGWTRLEELHLRHRRRARWALKQSWPTVERWILATLVPIAVAICAALLLALLALG